MTPQERDLINQLLARLNQAGSQPKDPEAESLIREAMGKQPDAPYYLVQTVLIQDMALANAQHRIADLERQAAQPAQPVAQGQPTSFLGSIFGRGAAPGGTSAAAGSVPASGPWSRPAPQPGPPPQGYYPQPGYAQPGYASPMMAQAMPMMASGGGFLRQAAATAAGIAGGALLFDGIQSLFGHHAGGILSNASMQPGLSETVINNYYGNDPSAAQPASWDPSQAGLDPSAGDPGAGGADPGLTSADSGGDPGADYASNQDYDPSQDVASNQDFGSDQGDFGGDSDLV